MGSVCKGSSSIGLMTGFSPAADNVPMVRPVCRIIVSPGPRASKSVSEPTVSPSSSRPHPDKMKYLNVGDLFLNKGGELGVLLHIMDSLVSIRNIHTLV